MKNIDELLLKASVKTAILNVILQMQDDPNYTTTDAIDNLLEIIEGHQL